MDPRKANKRASVALETEITHETVKVHMRFFFFLWEKASEGLSKLSTMLPKD